MLTDAFPVQNSWRCISLHSWQVIPPFSFSRASSTRECNSEQKLCLHLLEKTWTHSCHVCSGVVPRGLPAKWAQMGFAEQKWNHCCLFRSGPHNWACVEQPVDFFFPLLQHTYFFCSFLQESSPMSAMKEQCMSSTTRALWARTGLMELLL